MADTDVRSDIGKALENHLTPEQLTKLMDEVLAITKRAHGEFACKKCGQRQKQLVDVPDARAVVAAMTDLANQAWGRPGEQAKGESGITFVRTVIPPQE